MSQFYSMKAVLERLFGRPVYLTLKETATIADWRRETLRLISAITLAIDSTVQIADKEWRDEIAERIERGRSAIKDSETMDELFARLSATLIELVFMQIGQMPQPASFVKVIPLKAEYWTLDRFRSVQYVQSGKQREAVSNVQFGRIARIRADKDNGDCAEA